jgi:hypothetical protein
VPAPPPPVDPLARRAFESGNLVAALAEDAQPVADRGERDLAGTQVGLGGDEVGLALLPILERGTLCQIEVVLPPFGRLREFELRAHRIERRERRDQIVLRLHEFARRDRHQRRALLDLVAEPGDVPHDAAGIRGKDRRRQIVVERDIALGDGLGAKFLFDDRRRLDLRPFLYGRCERAAGGGPRLRRVGRRPAVRPNSDDSEEERGRGNDRQLQAARKTNGHDTLPEAGRKKEAPTRPCREPPARTGRLRPATFLRTFRRITIRQ